MAEYFLDGPQVCTTVEKVRGRRVSESVRADCLRTDDRCQHPGDEFVYRSGADPGTTATQHHRR